jgi:hypothetical protein
VRAAAALVLAMIMAPGAARGDEPWHGSIGAGGSLVLTGAGGDAFRLDGAIAYQPFERFGFVAAVRAFDDEPRDALVTAGITWEAAASRPRLAVALYGDAGIATAETLPVLGIGVRTTIAVFGPLGVIADTGAHLVLDGVDDTALVISSALLLAVVR